MTCTSAPSRARYLGSVLPRYPMFSENHGRIRTIRISFMRWIELGVKRPDAPDERLTLVYQLEETKAPEGRSMWGQTDIFTQLCAARAQKHRNSYRDRGRPVELVCITSSTSDPIHLT